MAHKEIIMSKEWQELIDVVNSKQECGQPNHPKLRKLADILLAHFSIHLTMLFYIIPSTIKQEIIKMKIRV